MNERTWAHVKIKTGTDGPMLGCDCYGGCWGDHSEDWPALVFVSERDAKEAYRLGHQNEDGTPLVEEKAEHGTRVLMGSELRFNTMAFLEAYAARLKLPLILPPGSIKIKAPGLTFDQLRRVNGQRGREWHGPGGLEAWTPLEWAGALCGEAGELANVAKKMKRIDDGIRGRESEQDKGPLVEKLADECADVLIYLDLLADRCGIDLGEAVRKKFNKTSEDRGFTHRL